MLTCIEAFELATQLKAVLLGQDNIKDNALWMLAEDFLKCFVAINSSHHVEPAIAQRGRDHCQFCPAIVNNKYLLPWHTSIPFLCKGAIRSARLMGKKGYRYPSGSHAQGLAPGASACAATQRTRRLPSSAQTRAHIIVACRHTRLPIYQMLFDSLDQLNRVKWLG